MFTQYLKRFVFFIVLCGGFIASIFDVMHDMVVKVTYWTWGASLEKERYEVGCDDMKEACI